MNSVLQCLSNTRPLLEYVAEDKYAPDINTSLSCMRGALIKGTAGTGGLGAGSWVGGGEGGGSWLGGV